MFLIDTNVVSELGRGPRANVAVHDWADTTLIEEMFLSVVTVMEVTIGVERLARRDPSRAGALREWVEHQVVERFTGRILSFDMAAAQRCALLHVPHPQPERDAIIAATALVHGLTVATRNVADFARTGASVFNPWTYGASV